MLKVCESDHENSRFVIFDLRPYFTKLRSFLVTKQNEQWQATKHNYHYHFQGNDLFSVMLFKVHENYTWKSSMMSCFENYSSSGKLYIRTSNCKWKLCPKTDQTHNDKSFLGVVVLFPKNVNQVVKRTSSTIFSLFYWSKIPKKRHLVLERHSGAQSNRFIIWRNSWRVLSAFNTTLFWTSHSPLLL